MSSESNPPNASDSQNDEELPPSLPSSTLCYAFEQLAAGAVVVEITFDGQVYLLRKTRNGKLILTK